MPIHNTEIAAILGEVANLLDIKGANEFRVRAYRNAERTVKDMSGSIAKRLEAGEDLSDYPGIGSGIAEKIAEIVKTGHLRQLDELRQAVPPELLEVMELEDLGPRRAKQLYDKLGISTIDELEQAAQQNRVREVEGFGAKTEQKILAQIAKRREQPVERRLLLPEAEEIAESYLRYLRDSGEVERIEVAGSYRRRKETVGDLDILAICKSGSQIMDRFTSYEDVDRVVSRGETRSTVMLTSGTQVDLRVLEERSYGSALLYFTGCKAHNIALRRIAQDMGYKISEYGVFEGQKQVAGESEQELYGVLEMAWVEPELREDRGEVEAARKGRLPQLLQTDDLRGDLHSHTSASDGSASLKQMAAAAQELGYDYLAVTDHSRGLPVAHGLDESALERQIEEIDQLNEQFDRFRLLKSCEVDIHEDGSLDLSDELLRRLDLVVCSVHSRFNIGRQKMTERIIRAMDNRYTTIIAHPTGRRIGVRDAYEVDVEKLMDAAAERGCFLEINAQPERLDLNDTCIRAAREIGVKLSISTDAHSPQNLNYIRYGVQQARRGWLEKDNVINTRSRTELLKLCKR